MHQANTLIKEEELKLNEIDFKLNKFKLLFLEFYLFSSLNKNYYIDQLIINLNINSN